MSGQSNLAPEVRAIWTDAYKYHATFEHMGNSPEEWDKCAKVMADIYNKHNAHPLAMKLLLCVYDYLGDMRKPIAMAEAERRAGIDQAV